MSKIHVVVGGQFGSEGKGHFAAALINREMQRNALSGMTRKPMVLVRVAGPNAGHTAYDAQGREWKLRQIPVGAVVDLEAPIVLGAGSEIDPNVLACEIGDLEAAGIPVRRRLAVDWQATVIEERHWQREQGSEALVHRVGSTGKGIGAARADRIMRGATIIGDISKADWGGLDIGKRDAQVINTAHLLRMYIRDRRDVLIEGTQGYGLGLHAGYYPYCTSSDCTVTAFMSMAGLHQWDGEVVPWVVLRNEVIRVAGNSGPMEEETSWRALGLPEEQTTVTLKTRRVGAWDQQLAQDAIVANGGSAVRVAYTMADHLRPELAGVYDFAPYEERDEAEEEIAAAIEEIRMRIEDTGADPTQLAWIGTGPNTGIWLD